MAPKVLLPPSFTDPGTIERVVSGPKGREVWDPDSQAWKPNGEMTDSLFTSRELTPSELRAAGIPD